MIWTPECRISGFDIRASECDSDASRRSRLRLNMRQISITIDHSDTNVQQTKLSAGAGVAMLNVLHIGKGASHWDGNWGEGGGISWSQGILFSTPIVSLVPPHPFHFTALWPSLAPFSPTLAAENNGGAKSFWLDAAGPPECCQSLKFHYANWLRCFTAQISNSAFSSGN
jgi:hypothetical protein